MEILSRHIEIDEESGIIGVKDVIDICIVDGDKDLGSLRIVQFEDGYVSADLSKVDVYSMQSPSAEAAILTEAGWILWSIYLGILIRAQRRRGLHVGVTSKLRSSICTGTIWSRMSF